ncbi:peptidase M10A [Desmophyllum pertusum]|uniref:Peptidase M10A n=1 Tax=Desmophyllum pertusum TaxID=174260 RepID=A0A9X0A847_9CNID|nr:peptidase M10A [Desmophyllum pertusum]
MEIISQKYLGQYGYISSTRSGNHDVATAITRFQEYFGLPVSGELDDATIGLMKMPRCGVSDSNGETRMRRYNAAGKWAKSHLTYYVQPGDDLSHDQQRRIFSRALKFWADVSGLSFSAANSASDADIKISFGRSSHGGTNVEGTCPYPFDGTGGVLAHAYFPEDGRAHFDEDETYTHGTASGTNLLWVATHEFGHSLGLGHSNVNGAIMYPYYTGYVEGMQLHSDDIAGIQYLYGSGSGGGVQTPAPTDSGNCLDRLDTSCAPYKDAGYCQKYPEDMKYWCGKTCSFCKLYI